MFILSQSSALLTPYNYYSIRRRLTIPKIICCQESFNRVVTHTALRSSSTQPFTSDNDSTTTLHLSVVANLAANTIVSPIVALQSGIGTLTVDPNHATFTLVKL